MKRPTCALLLAVMHIDKKQYKKQNQMFHFSMTLPLPWTLPLPLALTLPQVENIAPSV